MHHCCFIVNSVYFVNFLSTQMVTSVCIAMIWRFIYFANAQNKTLFGITAKVTNSVRTWSLYQTPARPACETLLTVNKSSSGEQVWSLQQSPRKGETGTTGKCTLQSLPEKDLMHQALQSSANSSEPHLRKDFKGAFRLQSQLSIWQWRPKNISVWLRLEWRGSSKGSSQTPPCPRGLSLPFSRWLFSLNLNWPDDGALH